MSLLRLWGLRAPALLSTPLMAPTLAWIGTQSRRSVKGSLHRHANALDQFPWGKLAI